MAKRLAQHIRNDFLTAQNYVTVQVKAISGDLKTLTTAEQRAIGELGGPQGGAIANKISAREAPPKNNQPQRP